ncbi:helix-turn-helix domain-containing protein [Paenibacillus mendelii]|uniref:Helix-turn-helix domain-containing protein n=1 Tax=Paenibacillus mendelii TaxID=206163 RepID=A0ABV6JD02_9BACL|nr:helix-turn-helix domain-containing protein [Paenibacillus mendelii]MCQ6562469.1 helix-turn-helix domain-containing protein [Paenibacillus mendelii]
MNVATNAFETIFHSFNVPMALIIKYGEEQRFDKVNTAFLKLAGYSEQELFQMSPSRLFSAWESTSNSDGIFCPYVLVTKYDRTLYVKLTCQTVESYDLPTRILIAEDITARLWIDTQLRTGNVMLYGIVDNQFIIQNIEENYPMPVFDSEFTVEDQSFFKIVHEDDLEPIEDAIKHYLNRRQPQHFKFRTKKLADLVDLEVTLTFSPFYNGDETLKNNGFVVTDLRAYSHPVDPSIKLKVLMARCNISAQQLSEATGISVQTISKLRNGKIGKPHRLTADLIATELNVKRQDIWE